MQKQTLTPLQETCSMPMPITVCTLATCSKRVAGQNEQLNALATRQRADEPGNVHMPLPSIFISKVDISNIFDIHLGNCKDLVYESI
jgi:hypothetical protein